MATKREADPGHCILKQSITCSLVIQSNFKTILSFGAVISLNMLFLKDCKNNFIHIFEMF